LIPGTSDGDGCVQLIGVLDGTAVTGHYCRSNRAIDLFRLMPDSSVFYRWCDQYQTGGLELWMSDIPGRSLQGVKTGKAQNEQIPSALPLERILAPE
jgi:hypothetical protein